MILLTPSNTCMKQALLYSFYSKENLNSTICLRHKFLGRHALEYKGRQIVRVEWKLMPGENLLVRAVLTVQSVIITRLTWGQQFHSHPKCQVGVSCTFLTLAKAPLCSTLYHYSGAHQSSWSTQLPFTTEKTGSQPINVLQVLPPSQQNIFGLRGLYKHQIRPGSKRGLMLIRVP